MDVRFWVIEPQTSTRELEQENWTREHSPERSRAHAFKPTRKVLLPLNGCRGLGRDVEDDAVDLGHRVGDARGNAGQDIVGQARPVGRHRILGGHGAQHDRVAVGATITLDAHGTNIGEQDDRALPDLLIHTCSCVVRTKHANPLQAPRTKIPPAYND